MGEIAVPREENRLRFMNISYWLRKHLLVLFFG